MQRSVSCSSALAGSAVLSLVVALASCGDSSDSEPGTSRSPSGLGDGGTGSPAGGSTSGGSSLGGSAAGGGAAGGLDAGSAGGAGGTGCLLKPNKDGWVELATNGAGVQGAVFTYASTSSRIEPLTSATMPFTNPGDGRLCVKGEGARVLNMDFGMYYGAGLAFDLCQAQSTMPTKHTIGQCPLGKTLTGIRFKLTGTTIPTELRVQFHEANREQSTYVLAHAGANEALFKDGKVLYDAMAPQVNVANIDSVHFVIPTNEEAAVPFDFCVEQIELVTSSGACSGGGAGGGMGNTGDAGTGSNTDAGSASSGCSKTGAWTTTAQYGNRNYGKYTVRNNFWNQGAGGAGSQTLWANSERCWGVDANHTDAAPKGTVKSYPDVQRGWGVGASGFPNSQHGLGIQVSQLTKAKIRWRMQAPTSGRTWALWDIYLHESANPGSGLAPVNIMIQQRIVDSDLWMQQDSAAWPKVTIGGVTFREKRETSTVSSTRNRVRLYVDNANGAVLGVDDLKLDLKAVIDHYVQEGVVRSGDYLTSIQAGFEVVAGGSYQTTEFWTAVQGEPDGP